MELSLTDILILAVVQGVTEFLPVSSSGHLVILAALMAPGGDVERFDVTDVNIVLHGGTLLSILVFYWRRICRLLGEDLRLPNAATWWCGIAASAAPSWPNWSSM